MLVGGDDVLRLIEPRAAQHRSNFLGARMGDAFVLGHDCAVRQPGRAAIARNLDPPRLRQATIGQRGR
jgi:hypothetical protein